MLAAKRGGGGTSVRIQAERAGCNPTSSPRRGPGSPGSLYLPCGRKLVTPPAMRAAQKGSCPLDGSVRPGPSNVSGRSGRPDSPGAMAAGWPARASPDSADPGLRDDTEMARKQGGERKMTEHEIAVLDAELTDVCAAVARLDAMVQRLATAISAAEPPRSPEAESPSPQAA